MEEGRRSAGDEHERPAPDTTAAAAFAPPPGSGRSIGLFLAVLVLVVCGVAGVLLLFTAVPVGYAVLLLVLALLAAVALGVTLRRKGRRGPS